MQKKAIDKKKKLRHIVQNFYRLISYKAVHMSNIINP